MAGARRIYATGTALKRKQQQRKRKWKEIMII
jgi:hypothetical protein